jgi:hypothetical protein
MLLLGSFINGVRTLISPNNPLNVTLGSSGAPPVDSSVNAQTVPMSGLFILATVLADPGRAAIFVQNQGPQPVQLVRDDGIDPTGATAGNMGTPGTVSTIILHGTTGGATGPLDKWESNTFKGRLRVYGTTGAGTAIVAIAQD